MALQDLTTLPTLKQWLPVASTNNNDDTTLARLLTAVSMDFLRATRRPDLLLSTYTEVHQGDGSSRLVAFHWPIVAVTDLTIAGSEVTASADKIALGYYIDADIDPERIWQVYLNGYVFTDGAAVKLTYSAGYVQPGTTPTAGQIALPGDIEQAVIDWCGYRYKQRLNVGVSSRRSTEGETAHLEIIDAPPNVLQVIERYKRELPSTDRRIQEREERLAKPYLRISGKGR